MLGVSFPLKVRFTRIAKGCPATMRGLFSILFTESVVQSTVLRSFLSAIKSFLLYKYLMGSNRLSGGRANTED